MQKTISEKKTAMLCNIIMIIITMVIGVLLYSYEGLKVFYEQNLGLLEIICLMITFLLTYFCTYITTKDIKVGVIVSILTLPIFYMVLKKLTFYLTVDEIKAINEQLYITDADAFTKDGNHWLSGDSRTNYVILGTLAKIAPMKLLASLNITPEQVTKALHTMIGIVVIEIIVMTTYIHSFKSTIKRYKSIIITVLYYAIMTMQVTLLSLKTVNYDLNSLLFALLAIMLMIYEIRENNAKLGLMAVISAMLATQDKMLAGPMLYLALLIFTIILTIKIQKNGVKMPLVVMALLVTMIPVIIGYISNYYVGLVLANGNIPSSTFYDTVYSYVQYSLTILEAVSDVFELSNKAVLLNILLLWVIFTIAAYITQYIVKRDIKLTHFAKKKRMLSIVGIVVILIMCVIAIISIYSDSYIYMSPLYPIEEGNYQSNSLMNGITYHYNAKTMLSHFLKLTATIIYIFYKSVPVGYMLLLIILGVIIVKNKKTPDISNIAFMVLAAVIFPLLYSLIQITPNERYQNVYILAFAYLVVVSVCEIIRTHKEKLILIVLMITLLNTLDVHRFDYAYTEYFALWDTAYMTQKEECTTGKMVPGYHAAWGEHVIYAGEMIAKYADEQNIPYSDITIHYEYYGQYINNGGMNIVVDNSKTWETCTIGENEYFVVSRGAATKEQAGGISIKLIENATPLFTFGYNGATEMWVYSGDEVERVREMTK